MTVSERTKSMVSGLRVVAGTTAKGKLIPKIRTPPSCIMLTTSTVSGMVVDKLTDVAASIAGTVLDYVKDSDAGKAAENASQSSTGKVAVSMAKSTLEATGGLTITSSSSSPLHHALFSAEILACAHNSLVEIASASATHISDVVSHG